ncbi:MAG: hypothetical protein ACYTKC_08780 [Planctomycetota bacterium]|jgi:hypothetical protein
MSRNRRRQIVINKSLQSRIVFATAWAPGLCLAGTALLLGVFCARLYSEALQADVSLPSILPVFMIAVAFMLVATAYMLFAALRFSHRIAGPMYNFGRTLKEFREGNIDARITLREHDYLEEVQDHINSFLDWLREHPPTNYPPIEATESAETDGATDTTGDDTAEAGAEDPEPEKATAGS